MKSLAYAVIAVILGVFVMLAPFLAVPTPTVTPAGNSYAEWGLSPQRALEGLDKKAEASESVAGVVPNYPIDIVSVSLMFLLSIALALGISLFLKKTQSVPKIKANH